MIISPFSVYHFLLGLPYEIRNEILRNLRKNLDSVDISSIYMDNPKNTFLRISSSNFNYIIKQPKLYMPEQSWMIDVEAEFYKEFKHKKYLINSFYYNNAHKTLFLPLLETLKFKGENLGYLVNQWHSDMLLKKQSNKNFSKNSILNNGTPYQRLVDILKITRNNRQSLNDTLYKVNLEGKALDQQEKIIDFLYEKNTKEFFIDWIDETKKIKTHIIHGDLRIENIILLQEQHKIIDFELVCEGDPMWDIAQIIESIFSQNIFKKNKLEIFEDKFNYLISFLKEYWSINNLSEKSQELQRILNYWALVKTYNLFNCTYDFLNKDITVIKRFIEDGDIFCECIINEKLTDNSFLFAKGCKYP